MEEKEENAADSVVQDGGSAWVAVVCAFLYHIIVGATIHSTGTLHQSFMEAFHSESGKISLISSILLAAMFISGTLYISIVVFQSLYSVK